MRTLSVSKPYHTPDAIEVALVDENLVANAGLLLVSTLAQRLALADVIADKVDLTGRVGGANKASKSLTLIYAMVAGASHMDHVVRHEVACYNCSERRNLSFS
jgi:hypothetical protein